MEKSKKGRIMLILSISLTIIAVGFASLLGYFGAFRSINIEEKTAGPFLFVYREMKGSDFSQVNTITTDLAELLQSKGLTNRKPLDIFYPEEVDQKPNEIGFTVEGGDFSLFGESDNVKTRTIEATSCMVTEFPWKSGFSFVIGYFRIDPALSKHRELKGYKKVEALVLNDGDRIIYMQPIVK